MKLLKHTTYVNIYYQNYQNMSKPKNRPPQIPSHRQFFENEKGPGTSFQVIFFVEFFDKNFSFVMLHNLAKFHQETFFTSLVIQ